MKWSWRTCAWLSVIHWPLLWSLKILQTDQCLHLGGHKCTSGVKMVVTFVSRCCLNIVSKSHKMSYKTNTGSRIFITCIVWWDINTLSFYVAIYSITGNGQWVWENIPNECNFQIDPSKTNFLNLLRILCVYKYRIYIM